MKPVAFTNGMRRIIVAFAAAAVLMLGLSVTASHNSGHTQRAMSPAHSVQVADGSESNGGKGGKGGAKLA
jgi:hypothetical protein